MNELALLQTKGAGGAALVASATLDGIAGAVIWAHRLGPLKTILFAGEGQAKSTLTAPALATSGIARFYALGLALVADDTPLALAIVRRPALREVVWLDHHHLNGALVEMLQGHNGARVVHNPAYRFSSQLLVDTLNDAPSWSRELAAALDRDIESVDEPWRSWLYVFLAVREEPYSIRHAITPLIDERFEAFDPALVAAGRQQWEELLSLASSPMHEVALDGLRLVIAGLPPSSQSAYRLLVDAIGKTKDARVVIAFFDTLPRLIVALTGRGASSIDLLHLGERVMAAGLSAFHYDRRTMFVDTVGLSSQAAIDRVVRALDDSPK